MARSRKSPVAAHRDRLRKSGLVRLEVNVRKDDAALVRDVAAALNDPARQERARLALRQTFGDPVAGGFKAFLASCPIDDPEFDRYLERPLDTGRDVDLS